MDVLKLNLPSGTATSRPRNVSLQLPSGTAGPGSPRYLKVHAIQAPLRRYLAEWVIAFGPFDKVDEEGTADRDLDEALNNLL